MVRIKKYSGVIVCLCIVLLIAASAAACAGKGVEAGGAGTASGGQGGQSQSGQNSQSGQGSQGGGAAAVKPAEPQPPKEPKYKRSPVTGARTLADGRQVGGSAKGKLGDELTNAFFSFKVNKAEYADAFEGLKPVKSYKFLALEITLKSAFDDPVPMWADDFFIQWGEGEKDYGYPIEKVSAAQMDEEFTLAVGASLTKQVVYEVPVPEGSAEYSVNFYEYYEDKTEGNQFSVIFTLEP